ncbi:hypothetical protein [Oerskovia paurometabola]|uniref:hypothetical protein n=1 Tax=Oerskovia paurometabola TaxID=162170 RepID=UPI00381C10CB
MSTHPKIGRPKVVIEPRDPANPKGMYIAWCDHCTWRVGPTAKSWLQDVEARAHRAAHREGKIPVTVAP